jgi:hypothetical protein
VNNAMHDMERAGIEMLEILRAPYNDQA